MRRIASRHALQYDARHANWSLDDAKAGESLVKTGGGNVTLPCTGCHGADLEGSGIIPRIVGRSAGYVVRQL